MRLDHLQSDAAVTGLRHDLYFRQLFEERANPRPDERMIIRNQNPDQPHGVLLHFTLCGG
jgi:hypothetical protein